MKNITLDKLITVDEFNFEFLEFLCSRVRAAIKIGNRSFIVSMQAARIIDLDLMKAHLERIILEYKLLGSLQFSSIFDRSVQISLYSIPFEKDDSVTRVTATKVGDDEPMISFYCRFPQVVSSIYMALLKLVQFDSDSYSLRDELEYIQYGPWANNAVMLYSRLKSIVIEDYIFDAMNTEISARDSITNVDAMRADYAFIGKALSSNVNYIQTEMIDTARKFLIAAKLINYNVTNDLSLLLPLLNHIKLKDGYRLKYYSIGEDGTFFFPDKPSKYYGNFNSYICVENIMSRKIFYKDLYQYFEFEFNDHSVWEFYLLLEYTINLLPCGWHGGYADHKIILSIKELSQIKPNMCFDDSWMVDMLNLYKDNSLLAPAVKILNRNTAVLTVTIFTNWGGLEQHHITVENINSNLKFNEACKFTLKYYDCGMLF